MGLKLNGATSGSIEIDVPAVAGTDTAITIPATSGGEFIVSDSAGDVNLDNGTFFVDASTNRCGIGTTSPARDLSIGDGSDDVIVNLMSGTGQFCLLDFGDTDNNAQGRIAYFNDQDCMTFRTGGSGEDVRIDSSGRLLVGASSDITGGANISAMQVVNGVGGGLILGRNDTSTSPNDILGLVRFYGNDSDGNYDECGRISVQADAEHSSTSKASRMVFYTNSGTENVTERMRITSAGAVRVGSTGSDLASHFQVVTGTSSQLSNDCAAYIEHSGSDWTLKLHHKYSTAYWLHFYKDGSSYGYIVNSGSGVNYYSASDYRLKTNIETLTGATERLKQLTPRRYEWLSEPGETVDGFIAHEVQEVVPQAVDGEKDGIDKHGNPKYQALDVAELIPLLTAALQESVARIETLEAKVAQLEGGAA
jgi:hypothetical protein